MNARELFAQNKTLFSFEFFPPKDPGASEQLFQTIKDLTSLRPSYVSVTYGAGGTTRTLTHDLVVRIQRETSLTVVSHLTCVGSTREEIGRILEQYQASGIENVLALRGDPPAGQRTWQGTAGGFTYAAELVAFIKLHHPAIGIGVAGFPEGHPEAINRLKEIDYLKAKVDAGADYICTQLFFDNRDFYDFVERCELAGIGVPIQAGIMPVVSRANMHRIADLAPHARFPARLLRTVASARDDATVARSGIHWATEQVRDLVSQGVRGVHFYTLNKSKPTLQIYKALGRALPGEEEPGG
jgi:methylenetetrahydrofolate reductase (NADPH)